MVHVPHWQMSHLVISKYQVDVLLLKEWDRGISWGTETDRGILSNSTSWTLITSILIKCLCIVHLYIGLFKALNLNSWGYTLISIHRRSPKIIKDLGIKGRVPLNWRLDGGKFKKLPYMVQQSMDLRWFLFTIIWIKVSMTISVGRVAITQSRTDSTDILMKLSIKNFHLLSLIKWGNLLLQLSI